MTFSRLAIPAVALCGLLALSSVQGQVVVPPVAGDLQAYIATQTAALTNTNNFSFGVYSDIHMIENPSYGLTRVQWQHLLTNWRDRGDLFGIIVGDLGYGGAADVDNVLSGPATIPGAPRLFYAMGNHELDGLGKRMWIDALLPGAVRPGSWTVQAQTPAGNADQAYYSFNVGAYTHFIVLDGDYTSFDGYNARARQAFGQNQLRWLIDDVRANANRNILVFVHEPIDQQVNGSTPFYTLIDKGSILDLLTVHPKQSFVFSGHFHSHKGITRWKGVNSVHVMTGADPFYGVRVMIAGDQISVQTDGALTDFDQHPMNQIEESGGQKIIHVAEDGTICGYTRALQMTPSAAVGSITPTSGPLMLASTAMTWYQPRFISEQLIKIQPGMRFSYDIQLADVTNGNDAVTVQPNWYMTNGVVPPLVVDQNGIQLSRRPSDGTAFLYNEDVPPLGGRATGQWYHRDFDLSALAGHYIDGLYLTGGAPRVSVGAIYVDNIRLTWPASSNPATVGGGQSLLSTQTPAVVNNVGANFELGMRFSSDTPGRITAIRFWKATGETGAHVGRIWASSGQSLASVTFTNESPAGWQEQALSAPLDIAANTQYVVSVNTTLNLYAATPSFFTSDRTSGNLRAPAAVNGVYSNYNAVGTFPSYTYASTNYFRDIVFVPGSPSPSDTILTNQVPAAQNFSTGANYELGTRFSSDVAGRLTAIRFWKAPGETGQHVGRLWSAAGQLLASVTFTSESASGWQEQMLATDVPISANTEYVVSVNTTNAVYVATQYAFVNGLTNGHLRAPAGSNGLYGPANVLGSFPNVSYASTNYFRDVRFVANP